MDSEGRNDSAEADHLRDELEPLWYQLSQTEKDRLNGLSEDLYSLVEDSPPLKPMNPQAQRGLVRALESKQAGQLEAAFVLFRRWATYIDPALLAYERGATWLKGGDPFTAAMFFARAERLNDEDSFYGFMHLYALEDAEPGAAASRADAILNEESPRWPALVALAAKIKLGAIRGLSTLEARPVLGRIAAIMERTLDRLASGTDPETVNSNKIFFPMAAAVLGYSYDRLGDVQGAIRSFNRGLEVDPTNDALRVDRAMRRYGIDPQAAAQDLEAVVAHQFPVVYPYFYLAHRYLVTGRFEDCRSLCERALRMDAPDAVHADLHEWHAISMHELRFPPDRVRADFEEAMRLSPDNERIRRNFIVFQNEANPRPSGPAAWTKPREDVIQAYGQEHYRPPLLNRLPEMISAA